jgi:4-carboxymuconolactone decarboxylase
VANLAVGNDRKTLVATVSQLLPFIGYPRTLNALKMINQGATQ